MRIESKTQCSLYIGKSSSPLDYIQVLNQPSVKNEPRRVMVGSPLIQHVGRGRWSSKFETSLDLLSKFWASWNYVGNLVLKTKGMN